MLQRLLSIVFVVLACAYATTASAQTPVSLAWDRNPEPDVTGYFVLYGTTPGVYERKIDVGNQTTYAFMPPVAGTTYHFSVQA